MHYKLSILALFMALMILPACASSPVGGGGSMRRELDALKMEVADLRDRARLGGAAGAGGTSQMEIENLKTSVQRLNENVETASVGGMSIRQQMEYISARLDRLEKRANLQPLSRDVVAAPPIPVVTPSAPAAYPPTGAQYPPTSEFPMEQPVGTAAPEAVTPPPPVPGIEAPAGPEPIPVAVPVTPSQRSSYDEGKEFFDQKNYPAAITKFQSYMSTESGGANVPAAQFYIGESHYFQNQFDEAILAYQELISGYPKNNFVSTALLKQGLSFQAIGDKSSARLIYQKVVREYPKSYAAGIARERLKTI
ncbi:MAG: tol-pal system protein YbgF [Deltaproteobacteria bacterium]|jgi:tol-pal system protein YbgF|nr:tol-pal system protein YbgF [Deltaproteobacteria bacterium]